MPEKILFSSPISKYKLIAIVFVFIVVFSIIGVVSQKSFDDGPDQGHPLFEVDFSAGAANHDLDMNDFDVSRIDTTMTDFVEPNNENVVTINSGLNVLGSVDVSDELEVGSDGSIGGNLNVYENIQIDGYLEVGESGSFGGSLDVGGGGSFGGNLDVSNNLDVGGDAVLGGNTEVGGSLDVLEDSSIGGSLEVDGPGDFGDDITVSGDGDFQGNLEVSDNLNVMGNGYIDGGFDVGGDFGVGGDAYIDNDLAVMNNHYVGGDSQIDGSLELGGELLMNNDIDMGGHDIINAGAFYYESDIRKKEEVESIDIDGRDIEEIEGLRYKIDDENRIGFSAQQMEKIFPELVYEDEKGYLSLDYIGMIPILLEELKSQRKEVEELEKDLEDIEEDLERLEKEVFED